jgi:hypothetical protein
MSKTVALAEGDSFNLPFKEAIDFLKQKISMPSKTWRDIAGRAHDRAFVVAGATKMEFLADIRNAMQRGIEGKLTLEQWHKEFETLVAKHGWTGWTGEGTESGRAWRSRVIFETNMRTAYAAGRYAQMTDPDVVKIYGYWRYMHAYSREPERARVEHKEVFNDRVLPWNDPWWDTHYPPNGWNCSCGVEPMREDEIEDEGLKIERNPPVATRTVVDPVTGGAHAVPVGIDFGWDHAPGRDWARGLVPKELQGPVPDQLSLPGLAPALSDTLLKNAKPFVKPMLAADVDARAAVDLFLTEFGASWDKPLAWRDPAGHVVAISKDLFTTDDSFKGGKYKRHPYMLRLAETLTDPDEIWIDFDWRSDTKKWVAVRRYLRVDPETAGYSAFTWSNKAWQGKTVFPVRKSGKEQPDLKYIERFRKGALLWRRPQN